MVITIKSIWFGSNVITTRVIFGLVFLNSITNAAWICWYLENVFSISKIFCWTKLSPSICLNWSTLFWIIRFLLGCAWQNLSQKCPSLTKSLPYCVHIISGHPISKVTVIHRWFHPETRNVTQYGRLTMFNQNTLFAPTIFMFK